MDAPDGPDCWVVSDGRPGMENQCVGLAEAVALPFVVKRIRPRAPWRWLPPRVWPAPLAALGGPDRLAPPWPRLMIATGRCTVAPAAAVRSRAAGATFAVQIQNPGIAVSRFDLVVAPRHDRLTAPNVVATRGALHRVTPRRLREAAQAFAPTVARMPRPLVAVLIGGRNRVYRFGAAEARWLAGGLTALARGGAGLAVTLSRRTGGAVERVLRDALAGLPSVIWSGAGANPYYGYLGLADAVVVTCDSVSMISEAAATGKPVWVAYLPGGSAKFRAFHDNLKRDGVTRGFTGRRLESWTYRPLADTALVAAEVRRRLQLPPLSADVSG